MRTRAQPLDRDCGGCGASQHKQRKQILKCVFPIIIIVNVRIICNVSECALVSRVRCVVPYSRGGARALLYA